MAWLNQGLVFAALSAGAAASYSHAPKLHTYVDPFIGTQGTAPGTGYNGGNVFPGAVVPWGMVKLGPDVTTLNASIGANGGYLPDGNITAFSMTHVSGTGGGPVYGVVGQMPLLALDNVNLVDNTTYMQTRAVNDSASVGYYRSEFENGLVTELSATSHVGHLKYTIPKSASEAHVLVDVSHYLPSYGGGNQAQYYSNGHIEVSEDGSKYTGWGVYRGAFSHIPNYKIYFCGKFNHAPKSHQVFTAPHTDPYPPETFNAQPTFVKGSSATGGPDYYQYGKRVGSLFTFSHVKELQSKVGISFKSVDNACGYIPDEIPHWNLKKTVAGAEDKWEEIMHKISTPDRSNHTRLTMFYTGMYHAHLMPTDRTGENANWETDEPSYDDYFTFWDTFRCLNSLWTLIDTQRSIDMVRSLIDIWRHEQFMPDGRSGNANGQVQGGSNSDNVLADAFVKGLRGGINWTDGYAAMKTNAELVPWENFDTGDPTGSTIQGRGALANWLQHGHLTPDVDRSVSRTVEYSLNDFSLSQVAKELAPEDYHKYLNRSSGWQLQWDPSLKSENFTGFIAPRFANGSRDPDFDPAVCPGYCEFGGYTYEALGWEYTWTVPFDMKTLIKFMGGPKKTEKRLDIMFKPGVKGGGVGNGDLNGIGTTLFNPGNEPSFATPFLYNYLPERQHRSVSRSREILNTYYGIGPSGLPGNSDAGALDSWMIWQMVGLYPIATQDVYLILAPMFSSIDMKVGLDEKTLKITAKNLSEKNIFVQSLKVNGKKWNKSWLTHDDIKNGGTLEFTLGKEPKAWDTGDIPPSPGHFTRKISE